MNLTHLPDHDLVVRTEDLVKKERLLLSGVLHHLREIERRRLFADPKYACSSLFNFAVSHLGYSEDQAYRRIAAMRLLKDLPEIQSHITNGALSLTHIGLAHSFFKVEEAHSGHKLTREEKLKVFNQIKAQPVRAAEKIVASIATSPKAIKKDHVRVITDQTIELKFCASSELQQKLSQLKGVLAHKAPNISLGELFEKLCDLGLEHWDPANKTARHKKQVVLTRETAPQPKTESRKATPAAPRGRTRYLPAAIKREVYAKAQGECENCKSRYALQIDHLVPFALGGESTLTNLRLLCRSCNQRAAVKVYGTDKMAQFI
jgi:5-methylcytosine-specific restriction endonuclease McrA